MIIILLAWLSHYLVLKAAGNLCLRFFPSAKFSWFDELLTGFCVLSFFAVILSLFIPVNAWTHLVLLIFSFFYLGVNKILFPKIKLNYGQIIIAVIILILAVPIPNHGDSAFYHAQAVKWIEHYKVVPGLGNFFGRLAFNSTFFNTQALFSFYPFSGIPSRFLNSFLVLNWFLHLFNMANNKDEKFNIRLLAILFGSITLCITRGWVSTIAPDVAVGLFMVILSFKLANGLFFNSHSSPAYLILLFFTAISIKLPAALLLPVIVFYLGINKMLKWQYILIPLTVMLPWLIRNIMLSGYLVYPYLPMIIWQPDWMVPPDLVAIERNWITSWARIPKGQWQDVLSLPFSKWFPHWFFSQYLINKVLVISFCITISGLIVQIIKNQFYKIKTAPVSKILLIWSLSIVIWFITAPDFRFGYGLILPFLLIAFFNFFQKFIHLNKQLLLVGKNSFLGLLTIFMLYVIIKEKTPLQNFILQPQPYDERPYNTIKTQIGIINLAPGDESCWDNPLPCINDDLFPKNIELRGTTLQDGFRPVSR